jgi:hypothetical protein
MYPDLIIYLRLIKLTGLNELKAFIDLNLHLPKIPAVAQIA